MKPPQISAEEWQDFKEDLLEMTRQIVPPLLLGIIVGGVVFYLGGSLAWSFAGFLVIAYVVFQSYGWWSATWLGRLQKPATVDIPLEPAILREKVISIVAQALGVNVAEVTEETRIGPNLYQITPHVALVAKKTVMLGTNDTVGDLLKEVCAK